MKKRLDLLLFEKNLVDTRTKAQALIMAGQVLVNGKKETKAGAKFDEYVKLEVLESPKYVGRGAEKIKGATKAFGLDFRNKTILDVGSSTGGFTDYALQNGAKKVYAIDVGTGQLHWRLRNDPRVVVMEKTDFRKLNALPESPDLILVDVSFVSVKKILEKIKKMRFENLSSKIVVLFKPQFEAGKKIADRFRGVIKDEKVHELLLADFRSWCKQEGFEILGEVESPIKGDKGNKEWLFYLNLRFEVLC